MKNCDDIRRREGIVFEQTIGSEITVKSYFEVL